MLKWVTMVLVFLSLCTLSSHAWVAQQNNKVIHMIHSRFSKIAGNLVLKAEENEVSSSSPKQNDNNNFGTSLLQLSISPEISFGAALAGYLIVLLNRFILSGGIDEVAASAVADAQARADILTVMASSAIALNALSATEITTRDRDRVNLVGYNLRSPILISSSDKVAFYNDKKLQKRIEWLLQSILPSTITNIPNKDDNDSANPKASSVTSVHIIDENLQLLGVLGVTAPVIGQFLANKSKNTTTTNCNNPCILADIQFDKATSPILRQSIQKEEEVYLPDLQILPGKIEFTYLPINTQSVLILPLIFTSDHDLNNDSTIKGRGAIVIATNQAKSLKLGDLQRIRSLVRLYELSSFTK